MLSLGPRHTTSPPRKWGCANQSLLGSQTDSGPESLEQHCQVSCSLVCFSEALAPEEVVGPGLLFSFLSGSAADLVAKKRGNKQR